MVISCEFEVESIRDSCIRKTVTYQQKRQRQKKNRKKKIESIIRLVMQYDVFHDVVRIVA